MRWTGRTTVLAAAISALSLSSCDRPAEDRTAETAVRTDAEKTGAVEAIAAGPTLAAIKRRGHLTCGVHEGLVGFAYTDNRGRWRGFDVDFCRALAAAILGDGNAVRFVPLNAAQRLPALRDGRIDVLWRNTSWTMGREAGEGYVFAGINYYDGQGFLVRRSLNLSSAAELDGAKICVQAGSTTRLNADDYFRARGIAYTPVVTASEEEARRAYDREDCDFMTFDDVHKHEVPSLP